MEEELPREKYDGDMEALIDKIKNLKKSSGIKVIFPSFEEQEKVTNEIDKRLEDDNFFTEPPYKLIRGWSGLLYSIGRAA